MRHRELSMAYILLAVGAGVLFWELSRDYLTTPRPYKAVEVIEASIDQRGFHLVANFTKTGCAFVRLDVVGSEFGESVRLDWIDDDDLAPNLDREKGTQTLRITADTQGREFDLIQVRTRHDCDGETVDRVFMEYRP